MNRTIRRILSAAVATASLVAVPAHATSITYTFGGTITDVEENNYPLALPGIGETVAGSLTVFLPQSWDSSQTDGATANYGRSDGMIGMVMGTVAFSDGSTFSLSRSAPSSLEELILRNFAGAQNELSVGATTVEDGNDRVISLVIFDNAGADSTLFADPDGGVSFSQPVNLAGETQAADFGASSIDYLSTYVGVFTLTSLTISSVPEPGTIALLLAGLCVLRATRRRPQPNPAA